MKMWKGMPWMAMEGSGVGIQGRFIHLVLANSGFGVNTLIALPKQFMNSAAKVVRRFGPSWTKREVYGQAIGVWLLALCWLVPPALLVLEAVIQKLVRLQCPS